MSTRGSGIRNLTPPRMMADAAISQANPVSTTLYPVLATNANVRLIDIGTNITWAVTQPTPLEIVVTIDGIALTYRQINPVSTQNYRPRRDLTAALQGMVGTSGDYKDQIPTFLLEGRSVKIEVRITWAVTQPTPLVCRVMWGKW